MSSAHNTAALQHEGLEEPLVCGTSYTAQLEETFHTGTAVPRHRIMKTTQMPLLALGGNC